jgi:bacterioferritin-associated ferredoxin
MLKWPRLLPESLSYLSALIGGGVKPRFGWVLQALSGDDRVREATLVRMGPSGNPLPGSEKTLAVDAVGIGFGLQPAARLARLAGCRLRYDPERRYFVPDVGGWGESSIPGVYVAGDGAGVGGADWSEIRGGLAGLHAAWSLCRIDTRQLEKRSRTLRLSEGKIASYLSRFHQVFTPGDGHYRMIPPETTVCRCEGVTAGEITARIWAGDRDLTRLKPARLGMGPCQGRGCEGIAAELLRREGVAPDLLEPLLLRPPLSPLPLSLFGAVERRREGE